MRGAVAAGAPRTAQAGARILREGGNAVDAAIAAQLMACVAEPLLTGLGGGGLATVHMGDEVVVCDFFANVPGLGGDPRPPMEEVVLDFGPTTQTFHVGAGAVSVPGVGLGMEALHQRYARLPLSQLVAPAMEAALEGVEVTPGFERVLDLLWPIVSRSAAMARGLGQDGRPHRVGEKLQLPQLASTLEAFGREGGRVFREGAIADAIVSCSAVTHHDLLAQQAHFRPAIGHRYRHAQIWTPGPPSQGGGLLVAALSALEQEPLPEPFGAEHVKAIARAMDAAERRRPDDLVHALFDGHYIERMTGFTTHISTVDEDGGAVSITSSLGETAGVIAPGTGVILNNFLGEEDVNPPGQERDAGKRLMTMCTPTIVQAFDDIFALGAGGSSRIRSAVLHGIVYLIDHGLAPHDVPAAPRSHFEAGQLRVERMHRPAGVVEALRADFPELIPFDEVGMYFGGLHLAARVDHEFSGNGDPRRSGAFWRA